MIKSAIQASLTQLKSLLHRPEPLRDKVALVTGASSGIGRATAVALAAEGAKVVVAARREGELEALAAELRGRGASALPVPVDVTRDADLERLLSEARRAFGRIDVLVNNAGVVHGGKLHRISPDQLNAMLDVNLRGTFRLTQLTLPLLLEQRSGHIVNVSSLVAHVPMPALAVYSATKAAIVNFSSALRRELRDTGVHVSTVLPGATKTPMIAVALDDYTTQTDDQSLLIKMFVRKLVEPEEVADEIVDVLRFRSREALLGGPTIAMSALLDKVAPGLVEAVMAQISPDRLQALVTKFGAEPRRP